MKPRITNHRSSQTLQRLCLSLFGLGVFFIHSFILNVQTTLAAEPIFAQQTKIVKGGIPQTNERFGISVVNGNWAAIGVPESDFISAQDQGIVYLYQRNGSSWTLAQLLIAGDGAAFDRFGSSIALSGTTLVIGAPEANGSNNRNNMGAVYVYKLSGGTWTLQQKLTASDGQASDRFGIAIGFNGSNIVVGAPGEYFTDAHTSGAAYVFGLSGSTWVQQQKLTASDVALGGGFGSAISMSGANLAISSRHNPFLSIPKGAVYSFQQSGGWWNYQQKLTSPSPLGATYSKFGHRISMSGTTLAIGGEILTVGTGEAVYVYTLSGTTWSLQQGVIPPTTTVCFLVQLLRWKAIVSW